MQILTFGRWRFRLGMSAVFLIFSVGVWPLSAANCTDFNRKLLSADENLIRFPEKSLAAGLQLIDEMDNYSSKCFAIYIRSLQLVGNAYHKLGRPDEAIIYFLRALRECESREGYDDLKAAVWGNLSLTYTDKGDYTRAVKYTYEALAFLVKEKDYYNLASLHNQLGNIYVVFNQHDSAYKYFNLGYRYVSMTGDSLSLIYPLSNLANLHTLAREYDRAEPLLQKCNRIARRFGEKEALCNAELNLGNLDLERKRYPAARKYLHRALALADSHRFELIKPKILITFAQIDLAEKKYPSALAFLDSAQTSARRNRHPEPLTWVLLFRKQIYEETGQWQLAYRTLTAYHYLQDSLSGKNNTEAIGKAKGQFEIEQKILAQELALKLESEKNLRLNNREYILIFLFVLSVPALMVFFSRLPIPPKVWNVIIFMSFLLIFEAVLVYVDYRMIPFTQGKPLPTLTLNFVLAALFTGIHQFLVGRMNLYYVRSLLGKTDALARLVRRRFK